MPEEPYAEEGDDDGRPWDEHRWERFLQASDRRTEKFGQLLEKYQDHPDRDAIVAREMGWDLEPEEDDEELEDWQREQLTELAPSPAPPAAQAASTEADVDEDDDDDDDEDLGGRRKHPLFLEAQAYAHRLLKVVVERDEAALQPLYEALTGGAMICAAKLSVLSLGEPRPELGMVIAYAKRGLKGLTDSLGAIDAARRASLLSAADALSLQNQAFQVRNGIISLMGELRAEFRRKHQ